MGKPIGKIDQEDGQFKMPLDDSVEDSPIPAGVNELRLEKLNTRVTILSVIIPVLLGIILVFTYLDIKRRMEQTEDTGTMGVQKLSNDLESRFSSLSVRQARLDDETIRLAQNIEKSFARIEVKLKNLTEAMDEVRKSGASKKELKGEMSQFDNKVLNLATGMDEIKSQLATLSQDLKSEVAQVAQALTDSQNQLQAMEEKISVLDDLKIDKPAMELALRLESLKIEQSLKAQLATMQAGLKTLDQKMARLSQQVNNAPNPVVPAPAGSGPASGKIQEQPLPQ